jgi:hypothetical protein
MSIVDRLEDLETTRNDQHKVNSKHNERIEAIESAILLPRDLAKRRSLFDLAMAQHMSFGTKKKPTMISLLEEKLDAALELLGVDVTRKGAEDPKYVATKKRTKK